MYKAIFVLGMYALFALIVFVGVHFKLKKSQKNENKIKKNS